MGYLLARSWSIHTIGFLMIAMLGSAIPAFFGTGRAGPDPIRITSQIVFYISCYLIFIAIILGISRTRALRVCPQCKKVGSLRLGRHSRTLHCTACGQSFERAGGKLSVKAGGTGKVPRYRQAFRQVDRPLSADALELVVDRSTCGALLGKKRSIDPRDFIHRGDRKTPEKTAEPVAYEETTVGRLLWRKRQRSGQAPREDVAGGPLWDPWLDG